MVFSARFGSTPQRFQDRVMDYAIFDLSGRFEEALRRGPDAKIAARIGGASKDA